jgi:hypothetical protein
MTTTSITVPGLSGVLRMTWVAGVSGNLVTGLGGKLRDAQAAAGRRAHDVVAGRTAALGHRLLRASLRPPRPPVPAVHGAASNGPGTGDKPTC